MGYSQAMRSRLVPALVVVLLGTATDMGCRGPTPSSRRVTPSATNTAEPPTVPCPDLSGEVELSLVDASDQQLAISSRAKESGVVVVRYDCAGFEILDGCSALGSYTRAETSGERTYRVEDRDALVRHLPLAADRYRSAVNQGQRVEIAVRELGRWSTTVGTVFVDELSGDCAGATHFVAMVAVGAEAVRVRSPEPPVLPKDTDTPTRLLLKPVLPARLPSAWGPVQPQRARWIRERIRVKAVLLDLPCTARRFGLRWPFRIPRR